jgi:Ferritin-like
MSTATPTNAAGPSSWTIEDLREHLVAAVQLELTTIPPYLAALFSLHDAANLEAILVIRSVVLEEMLHMVLAANVLNAIGGRPRITADYAPRYPAALPYHDPPTFEVGIRAFDDLALDAFLAIENPTYPVTAPPPASSNASVPLVTRLARERSYPTIGAFYAAIELGLRTLDRTGELFTGDRARQIVPERYYAGGGEVIEVHDLQTALAALEQIVEQGEGELRQPPPQEKFDPDRDLAHYYRFNELRKRRRYLPGDDPATPTGPAILLDLDGIYPMKPNWRPADPAGELGQLAVAFDQLYGELLDQLQHALDGRPQEMTDAVGTMWQLKLAAIDLLRIPLGDGSGRNAGPTFRYPS